MRQRGTTLLLAISGTLAGATVLLFLLLTGSAQLADAKTHTLSGAQTAVLEEGEDGGNDWTHDQERLITTAAAKVATSPLRPPQPNFADTGQTDGPPTLLRRPQKVPSSDDPSPH